MSPNNARPNASYPYFDPGLDCEQTAPLTRQYAYTVAITFLEVVELTDSPTAIGVTGAGHRTVYLRQLGSDGVWRWVRTTEGEPPAPVTRPAPQDARSIEGDLITVYGDFRAKHEVSEELIEFLEGDADAPGETTTVRVGDREYFAPLPMPPERVQ